MKREAEYGGKGIAASDTADAAGTPGETEKEMGD
jgi:hypothetical protein